jgi:hypothetical protein
LRESDVGQDERIVPIFLSQAKARVEIVRAERAYYAALGRPSKDRQQLLDQAKLNLSKSFFAFPTAANIYENLNSGQGQTNDREAVWEARRQQYAALLRALDGPVVPRSVKTSDLLSPFDGKPLKYSYDGKQIVITVSGFESDSKPVQLKIPPDKALKK